MKTKLLAVLGMSLLVQVGVAQEPSSGVNTEGFERCKQDVEDHPEHVAQILGNATCEDIFGVLPEDTEAGEED